MKASSASEARDRLRAVADALATSGRDATGSAGADLRRVLGGLKAEAPAVARSGVFSARIRHCFEAALAAGATLDDLDRARLTIGAQPTKSGIATSVVQTSVRFALVAMVRIVSQTRFESRQATDAAAARLHAAFGPAEEYAADQRDNAVYRALVTLHAAATRDLAQRARQLPRIVRFEFPSPQPALVLVNRLYGDAGRLGEFIAENRMVHPLFAPGTGTALSA